MHMNPEYVDPLQAHNTRLLGRMNSAVGSSDVNSCNVQCLESALKPHAIIFPVYKPRIHKRI